MPAFWVSHVKTNIVLYGALLANLAIAVAKFIAAGITGSSSMLTEGVHSLVDSGNQLLLLHGQSAAAKPPDHTHPFGYGRELYFWAFVVAMLIFAVGAGVSIYEGIIHYNDPEPLRDPTVNYIVLAVALLFEGTSWFVAIKSLSSREFGDSWWQSIVSSKDPALFVVLFEDTAALAGLIIAGAGVWASHYFNAPRLDGIASILIGSVLAAVAIFLAREAKGLIIGESAHPEIIRQVREALEACADITSVNHIRTIHSAPNAVFVAISADFDDRISMGEGEMLIEQIETKLKRLSPLFSSIYIRPEKAHDAVTVASRP